jgi:hypothetical protein
VNAVSIANNHMLDYGEKALLETMEHLDAASIRHVGAGRSYEEANRPLILDLQGRRVAILAYCLIYSASTRPARGNRPGISDHRLRRILARIRELARSNHLVIVSLHWGLEYSLYPVPYKRVWARRMVKAGARLVLGHGPHYPQGVETGHGGARVVYSLGNFIFDEPQPLSRVGFVYRAELTPEGPPLTESIHPFELRDHVPVLLHGERARWVSRLVEGLTASYSQKSRRFWRLVNSLWFLDIIWRVRTMRSLRFAFLPPVSFYFALDLRSVVRRFGLASFTHFLSTAWRVWLRGRNPYRVEGADSSARS